MGTIIVNNIQELINANKLWNKRVKDMQTHVLSNFADLSKNISQDIVKKVKFQGTLFSSIKKINNNDNMVSVISSTPGQYGYGIEKGIPPADFVTFTEQPLLKTWVEKKLMNIAHNKAKAKYFLRIGGVNVGRKGYPYGYPKGLRFMEKGYKVTVLNSDSIIEKEMIKLNT